MKIICLIFPLVLFFSTQAFCWVEDYGISAGQTDIQASSDEQYRWLYVQIIPENLRNELPEEAFKSFRVHLQDSLKIFPKPEKIKLVNFNNIKKIQGTITYAGIVKKKYAYDLISSPEQIILNVRVHLQNPTVVDKQSFAEKMKNAEKTLER